MYTNSLREFIRNTDKYYYSLLSQDALKGYKIMFAGSFNPLHAGHLAIINDVEKNNGTCLMEVCISRFDKTQLTEEEVWSIQNQFVGLNRPVVFTKWNTFLSKTQVFGSLPCERTFIVGNDTIERIAMTKYYYDSLSEANRIWSDLRRKKIKFLVYPRVGYNIENHQLPVILQSITDFRLTKKQCPELGFEPINVSSSQLRKVVDVSN